MTEINEPESAGEMLQRLGADAKLWAEEFNKTAKVLGYSDMDEGWLIGWFANAIENTCVTRKCRSDLSVGQPVAVKPLEWSTQNSHGWTVHVAKGLGCTYEASAKVWNDGWIWGLAEDDSNFDAEDEEAAKAAAQQDYETRIRSALVPPAVPGEVEKPVICIGRSTISRLMAGEEVEIDAAIMIPASDLNEPASVEGSPLLEWAVEQWKRQVSGRPLQNVHRRSLDDVWRQVIRWAGGDPIVLLGPAHDELRAAEGPWS